MISLPAASLVILAVWLGWASVAWLAGTPFALDVALFAATVLAGLWLQRRLARCAQCGGWYAPSYHGSAHGCTEASDVERRCGPPSTEHS
jgi:hypothetical protein